MSGRRLYHTTICDLVDREVMEVVEGQGREKVEEYLEELPQPERVKVVVDKFHLIRHVNKALDKVRSRLQGGNSRLLRSETCYRVGIPYSRGLNGLLAGKERN